ncbi:hypothetical protein [Acetivibrio cellulolyticus]|uniref:hypothetical protein n=1 Tax=Acetivibrio cellulolyticus TaxID=35830 RepID=UPI0001E2C7DA|nr:hypothetical protein [Acetivibrio cellulolyticus]
MVKVNGYELVCPICKGKNFEKRSSLLNSRGMAFLGLDWASQSALNYICDTCGYIQWFIDDGREYIETYYEEKKIETQDLPLDYETSEAEKDECPICFSKRDVNQKECTNCGHSFE